MPWVAKGIVVDKAVQGLTHQMSDRWRPFDDIVVRNVEEAVRGPR
jgi:hypothetical protein